MSQNKLNGLVPPDSDTNPDSSNKPSISTTSISNELDKRLTILAARIVDKEMLPTHAIAEALNAIQHLHNADIEAARLEARKEQIMQDFLSLNLDGLGAEDEAMLIQWRDQQLAELQSIQENNHGE